MLPTDIQQCKISFHLEVFQLDYTNVDNLDIILKHLTELFIQIKVSYVELTSNLRNGQHFVFKFNEFKSKSSFTPPQKAAHPEEPCLDIWTGYMTIDQSIQSLDEVLNHLSGYHGIVTQVFTKSDAEIPVTNSSSSKIGLLWKFDDKNNDGFCRFSTLDAICNFYEHELEINKFSFGNLINGSRFVEQFNSSHINKRSLISSSSLKLRHTDEKIDLIITIYDLQWGFQTFLLVFPYSSVKAVIISRSEYKNLQIFFNLSHPPKIYIKAEDMDPETIDMKKGQFYSFNYDLFRSNPKEKQSLGKEYWTRWHDCNENLISSRIIGKSSTFALNVPCHSKNFEMVNLIKKFNVWRRYSDLQVYFSPVEIIKRFCDPKTLLRDFPFEVKYAIQCVESVSYSFQVDLMLNNQLDEFHNFIREQIDAQKTKQLVAALYKLSADYLGNYVYHGLSRLRKIFKRIEKDWSLIYKVDLELESNPYIKHCRRVLLTPTRILALPEFAFQSCIFLKKAEKDAILRLSIRDEDLGDLGFSVSRNAEDVKRHEGREKCLNCPAAKLPSPKEYFLRKCFKERLLPSLNIAGKCYEFYGASASQVRNHGMVLYAEDSLHRNADAMLKEFGIIKPCGVSKHLTRTGLSLSQVLAFVKLPDDIEVRYTHDVLGGVHPESKNPYNFTDGCGLISPLLAEYIWRDLKEQDIMKSNEAKPMPTAYQIRFMGCKGMLVLDEKLKGNVIVLRESMVKLGCKLDDIGIVKLAEPRRAYLNRPLITILNQIGLSNNFFLTLLSEAIGGLVDSFSYNEKAAETLTHFSDLHRFINYEKLKDLGYDLLGDPFFRSALELVFHQALDVIKQKARIPLDFSTARTLFGVADPIATHHLPYAIVPKSDEQNLEIFNQNDEMIYTASSCSTLHFDEKTEKTLERATLESYKLRKGALKSGQVFIFPSDFEKPLSGYVLVTKFPCMHPGDVRRLEAVDVPELYRIRDCIVFPVDGNRPHPNEMAGSDLDGDEYSVMWAPEFMNVSMHDPMNFPDPPGEKHTQINNEKIVNFYMRYFLDNTIGRIASSHLVWADMRPEGIFDPLCLKLCEAYSISLDFVKTGISKPLSKEERYQECAEFLEKMDYKPSYHSCRALGLIYRTILLFELFLAEETDRVKILEHVIDHRLEHSNWEKYKRKAITQHKIYCTNVSYILDVYGFADEVELFTQINEKSDLFGSVATKVCQAVDRQDSVVYCVRNLLIKPLEDNFYEEFNSPNSEWHSRPESELKEAYEAKASAYYMVTMKMNKTKKKTYFGLPWLGRYSNHLLSLLGKAEVKSDYQNRLAVQRGPLSAAGGFSGSLQNRKQAAEECWQLLAEWLQGYLEYQQVVGVELDRLMGDMRNLFDNIAEYYISNKRRTQSPGSILLKIFRHLRSKQQVLDFEKNLFDSCNDPIGLMTVLILEKKYYEGIKASKSPDVSFNYLANSTYRVLTCIMEEASDEANRFSDYLRKISGCVDICYTPMNSSIPSYKLSIYGSRASIAICQVIILLHNRLESKNTHYFFHYPPYY